jgi:hypothetical protein
VPKLCFVIGPIGDASGDVRVHADWLLDGIIKRVMSDFPEFIVKRADQDPRPGLIDAQMINDLLNADLVIADLTFQNPNAFYEIGIRHMAQKPIIHMQLDTEQIPFDVSLYRAIKYSRVRYSDVLDARNQLKAAVAAVLDNTYQVENPVTRTRGVVALEERATSGEKIVFEQLRAIQNRLERLERPPARISLDMLRGNLSHRDIKPPNIFYGGGEAVPLSTTILRFISDTGLTETAAGLIQAVLLSKCGVVTQISRGSKELVVGVPGEIDINDIELPKELSGIAIVVTGQYGAPGS